jgi:hypothetical protein
MAHLVAFSGIKEKNVIRIRHRLVLSDVTQIYAPIWEYEMRSGCEFLRGAMLALARAAHVTQ